MRRLLVLCCVVFLPTSAWAGGIAVFDANQAMQQALIYKQQLAEYAKQLQQYQNEIAMLSNQVKQIQHLATSVEHGARNLVTLRYSSVQDLLRLGQQLQQKLSQAEMIGYQVTRATTNAETLYPRVASLLTGPQLREYERTWAQAQREETQIGISMQSIYESQQQQMARITALTLAAEQARGNMQINQVQAQMAATGLYTQEDIRAQLATMGRLQAVEAGRTAVLREATEAFEAQIAEHTIVGTAPKGRVLGLGRPR